MSSEQNRSDIEGDGPRQQQQQSRAQPGLLESWRSYRSRLENELDPQVFEAYIKPLVAEAEEGGLSLYCPSVFIRNHVEREFGSEIRKILQNGGGVQVLGRPISLNFHVRRGEVRQEEPYIIVKRSAQREVAARPISRPAGPPVSSGLNSKYTFDTYVVGNSNQFSHAAAIRVSEAPGRNYNPLFIYGGVGLGKTHLLHAIGNAVKERNPEASVLYMSSENFTNELIMSLRNAKMEEFKRRFRSIDLLLIDDIQFMSGKERTQEEFFHTFNALYNDKKQIVITSDKLPSAIAGIEERLQTRFFWGLTADIQAPDFETRVAILKRKASTDEISLPEGVAHFIAEHISSNVRELEGALTRLHAVSSLQKVPISLELAGAALKPLIQKKPANVSVDDIKRVVSGHFGLKVSEMTSKRRTKNLSFPRHIAMYLCRKHTTLSYPEIGQHFGGRDHSSVIHAAHVVSAKLSSNDEVRRHMEEIEKKLAS